VTVLFRRPDAGPECMPGEEPGGSQYLLNQGLPTPTRCVAFLDGGDDARKLELIALF